MNLSDLAAKGARPIAILVSHMLGHGDERFAHGLGEICDAYDVPLIGGDTVRAEGRRVWGCTAIGTASSAPAPDRRGAAPGDAVYVTGPLGRAMLGMEERGSGSVNDLAYRRPLPLLAEGQALAPFVSAMMDISDGLLLDSWRMARASHVQFALETARIPVADTARTDDCLRWGDDYQLLFTVPPDHSLPIDAHRIGDVVAGNVPVTLDNRALTEPDKLGYSH